MDQIKPKIGDTVHYTAANHHCRAAIITDITIKEGGRGGDLYLVRLTVFAPDILFFTRSVRFDPRAQPATWHWMETCPRAPFPQYLASVTADDETNES